MSYSHALKLRDYTQFGKCESFVYPMAIIGNTIHLLPVLARFSWGLMKPKLLSLTELPPGMAAVVQAVESPPMTFGNLARRLAEIGFLPGESVRVLRRVAGGEPIAVRIGGSTFALRKHEAQCITVRC